MREYIGRTAKNVIAAAAALALTYALSGCGGLPSAPNLPKPSPTPVAKSHIKGKVRGTFSNRDICNYDIAFGDQQGAKNPDCSYELDILPGTYSAVITSNSLLLPRKRTVEIFAPSTGALTATHDFDGIESDSGFNIEHYNQVGLGSYEPGINHGASVRFRPGVNPRVVFVKEGAPAGGEAMVKRASGVIRELTGGLLSYSFEVANAKPSPSEGMIIVSYPGVNSGGARVVTTNYIISNSDITLPGHWNNENFGLLTEHELGHGIGLDHSPNGIMNKHCGVCPPSRDDVQAATLKYMRNPGSTTLNSFDED